MDLLMTMITSILDAMAPTTWILVLGTLISFNLLRKALF